MRNIACGFVVLLTAAVTASGARADIINGGFENGTHLDAGGFAVPNGWVASNYLFNTVANVPSNVFSGMFALQIGNTQSGRLFFREQLEPGTTAYNLTRAIRIVGPLNTTFSANRD